MLLGRAKAIAHMLQEDVADVPRPEGPRVRMVQRQGLGVRKDAYSIL